jgi:hypothetical protein
LIQIRVREPAWRHDEIQAGFGPAAPRDADSCDGSFLEKTRTVMHVDCDERRHDERQLVVVVLVLGAVALTKYVFTR